MLRPVERPKIKNWSMEAYSSLKQLQLFGQQGVTFVETKYDGWGVQLILPSTRSREKVQLFGRETLPSYELSLGNIGLQRWLETFEAHRQEDDGYVILGELLSRGEDGKFLPAARVPSKLKQFREKGKADSSLVFIAYAVGCVEGEEPKRWPPNLHRLVLGVELGLDIPQAWPELSVDPHPKNLNFAAQANGLEGFVVKHPGHPWFKYKVERTADVVIMSFKPGNGKYRGLIGSIHCGAWDGGNLVEVTSVSGMDDDIRYELSKDPPSFVGSVIEVEYQERSIKRLRHPRFKRFRPDKPARECLLATL